MCGVIPLLLSFGKEKMWISPFYFHLADTVLFLKACVRLISNKVFLSFLSLPGRSWGGHRRDEGQFYTPLQRLKQGTFKSKSWS